MDLDYVTGMIMRIGVILSIALVALGVIIIVVEGHASNYSESVLFSRTSYVNSSIASINYIVKGFSNISGLSFIYLGLIVLVSIPVLRTALALAYFAHEKNRLYIVLTIIVVFNLLFAILLLPSLIR
ncbi:DUF1634 domain-containing protein [Acidianus sp. HS-5]|uniref:DUF1634 domain-containing protein n=1 Tax=Acidianus sp. HS-5 TaxID=2886040 RepID=UPI001F32BC45|nr:DUF1634 domain-containing protein [Acidianus sp. HS-5]BDC18436.1 hypothetical protein HS5_13260 [Acidianus sp. HS-5]